MKNKILYLHPHFTLPGGAGNFVLETGIRLADMGYEVIVVSINADDKIVGQYKDKIKFTDVGGPLSSSVWFWLFFPISIYKVFRVLNKYKDFVLFPQVFPANWWGFLYKVFYPKTKLVWMCQEPSAFIHSKAWINAIKSPMMRFFAKLLNSPLKIIDILLAKNVDKVIANSKFSKQQILKVYGYKESLVEHVYLGVDDKLFKPDSSVKKIPNQIITVSRLTKFKNVDVIIKALSKVVEQVPSAKLLVVGEGEEKQNLINLTNELNLEKNVIFLGKISNEELVRRYQESEVYVSAAINEPFGLSAVEANACSLRVLAHNSGGLSELIDDSCGYKYNDLSCDSLSKALTNSLREGKLANVIGLNWCSCVEKLSHSL